MNPNGPEMPDGGRHPGRGAPPTAVAEGLCVRTSYCDFLQVNWVMVRPSSSLTLKLPPAERYLAKTAKSGILLTSMISERSGASTWPPPGFAPSISSWNWPHLIRL